jgi:hypothetical protein
LAARAPPLSIRGVPSNALTLPFTVSHRDASGLFAIEATVVAWREEPRQPGQVCPIWLTLGPGTLRDADKGAFPLDGLELLVRVAHDGIEPIGVLNPGPLSDFQQEALLVLVAGAINDAGFRLSSPQE